MENEYKSKILNIFSARMKCGQSFIEHVESLPITKQKNIDINMNIHGLYAELVRYLFCSKKRVVLPDDPNLLPEHMYIYISDIYDINSKSTGKILDIFCPYDVILLEKYNGYKVYDKLDIELFTNTLNEEPFTVEKARIYRFENLELNDKFDIVLTFHSFLIDFVNMNIEIMPNGQCILDAGDEYTGVVNNYWDRENLSVFAFHTTYVLLYKLLTDIEKLKLDVVYKNVPIVLIENEKFCDITSIPAPYYKFKLHCDHDISFVALMGILIHSNNELKCPVCRADLKLKLYSTCTKTIKKNILIDKISTECTEYLLSLINNNSCEDHKYNKCDEREGYITYQLSENYHHKRSNCMGVLNIINEIIGNGDNDSEYTRIDCENECNDNHEDNEYTADENDEDEDEDDGNEE